MAESQGYLPQIGKADAWSWVFFGAGLYGLLGSLWRAASPRYPNPLTGVYLWAAFLMIIGLGGATGLKITWPLILVVLGIVLLGRVLLRRS